MPHRFCEIHHLDWWSRGGRTDLHLLVPYCWTHHHLHEIGYTATLAEDDRYRGGHRLQHRRPDGTPLPDPGPALHEVLSQLALPIG